jgi:preprotein translocase subunit SecY
MIGSFFTTSSTLTNLFTIGNEFKGFQWSTLMYAILIVLFSYYQANMQVNPADTAENLATQNAYIPGIRQGKETEKHISKVLNRITFIGMCGLLFIALMPYILPLIFPSLNASLAFGGTGLIIVVGVATETTTQIISKLNSKQYKGFSY